MPRRETELYWIDVLVSIEKVKRYTKDFQTETEFLADDLAYAATIRELEVIGEALKNILEDPAYSYKVNQYWRFIVNFRNVLAHNYFSIHVDIVFHAAKSKILDFEGEFLEFVESQANDVFYEGLEDTKDELEDMKWLDTLAYLRAFQKQLQN